MDRKYSSTIEFDNQIREFIKKYNKNNDQRVQKFRNYKDLADFQKIEKLQIKAKQLIYCK